MEKILSNERWFNRLVYARSIALVLLLFTVALMLALGTSWGSGNPLTKAIVISLLLLITLLQLLQRPSFLEVLAHPDALIIRLYVPDNRLLFFLRRKQIRTFIVHSEDELRVHAQYGRWPWDRKLQFAVARADGSQWRSPVLDLGWATAQELKKIKALPERWRA